MNQIQISSRLQDSAQNASLTFAAPGAGKYNCLRSLTVQSDAAADITITSGTKVWRGAVDGTLLEKAWATDFPWIGAENASVVIAVSAGNYTISAEGFVTP